MGAGRAGQGPWQGDTGNILEKFSLGLGNRLRAATWPGAPASEAGGRWRKGRQLQGRPAGWAWGVAGGVRPGAQGLRGSAWRSGVGAPGPRFLLGGSAPQPLRSEPPRRPAVPGVLPASSSPLSSVRAPVPPTLPAPPPSASHDLGETRAGSSGDCFPTGRRPGRGRERTLLALGAWAPGGLRRPRPTPPAHWPRLRAGVRAKEALVPSPARVPFPPVAIREFAPCPPGRGGREDRGADPAEGCDALPSLPEGSSPQDRPSLPAREGLGFPEKTSLIRRNGLLGAAPSSSCGPRRGCPSETRRSRLCPDAARHLPAGFPGTPESNAREGESRTASLCPAQTVLPSWVRRGGAASPRHAGLLVQQPDGARCAVPSALSPLPGPRVLEGG
ncbi:collagen alpha-1(I) chain-like [Symphalangus syndactylus]|uniref:collagen alpha-1(I) chain-like n=1 Tax=Symphalangus syndactylus TaxID=9590 RepID=UPI00300624B4